MCDWYEIEDIVCDYPEPQDIVDLYDKTIKDEGDLDAQLKSLSTKTYG